MSNIRAEKIDIVSIDSLIPHPDNMNEHPPEQIEGLMKIIEYQGFRSPITVQKGTNLIVAGHGRLEAARKMGYKKLPVIFQEFDSEAQLYAHMSADNALQAWSVLNKDKITAKLEDLGSDFDLDFLGVKDFVIEAKDTPLPDLNSRDPDCQAVTFVLSNEQKDLLDQALKKAKSEEDCSDGINQNSNGNALAAALRRYVYG